ncbi:hypothetical protein PRUPE_8G109600 [Prunus persica]|uniref:Uncharacterized protein n=1 Tax=Prunus persica TaxID=3760 RepID=M5VUU8_PRUPE|nr:hypothetical protein PRUPE_8G109600 [Prunus persica]
MKKIVLCLVVLSSLFLSQQSVFEVVFPGNEVPKWFSCCRDLKERSECEVAVEIPPNFKWSKTGLALCAAVEIKQNRSGNCCLIARVYMDEECSHEHAVYFDSKERSQLTCGCIIPFHTMIAKTRSGLPPYKFQVSFELTIKGSVFFESCGVHLVIKDDLPVPKTKFFLNHCLQM